jgi:cytoskeletal protein RodZ
MTSYTTPAHYRPSHKRESDPGVLVKVVALFLGIAVAVLVVAVVAMMQATDEARDEAKAAGQPAATTATEHDHSNSSSAVSLPLQSFAGTTAENAEELAMAHKATTATLPPIPAGS